MRIAVAFMSFDRPDHLQSVIQTVLAQIKPADVEYHYFLFQDGWRHRRTGEAKCDPKLASQCVSMFRSYLPQGEVFYDDQNLGVAKNFDRAECALYLDYGYDVAIFLEDDMLLQPHYFNCLQELICFALESDYVGMVSAYGYDVHTALAEQRARQHEVCTMTQHNWAFALTRACWLERDKIVRRYLKTIDNIDYRERGRFHPEIFAWQYSLGRGGKGYLSSQDSIKNMACEIIGRFRITTFTNNALYIGRTGEHMSPERFEKLGYHKTILYPEAHASFERPSAEELLRRRQLSIGK